MIHIIGEAGRKASVVRACVGLNPNYFSELSHYSPVMAWSLPPSDNVYYPIGESDYGPLMSDYEPGFLDGELGPDEPHPCLHSTIDGVAMLPTTEPFPEADGFWLREHGNYFGWYTSDFISLDGQMKYGSYTDRYDEFPVLDRDGKVVANPAKHLMDGAVQDFGFFIPVDGSVASTIPSALDGGSHFCVGRAFGNAPPQGDAIGEVWYYLAISASRTRLTYQSRYNGAYATFGLPPGAPPVDTPFKQYYQLFKAEGTVDWLGIRSPSPGVYLATVRRRQVVRKWSTWLFKTSWDYDGVVSDTESVVEIPVVVFGVTEFRSGSFQSPEYYCNLGPSRVRNLADPQKAKVARTRAISDVDRLDSNWIENLSGLKGSQSVTDPLIRGWRAASAGDGAAAKLALADAYLTYKYVVSPGISDLKDVDQNGLRLTLDLHAQHYMRERRKGFVKSTIPYGDDVAHVYDAVTYWLTVQNNPYAQVWSALESFGLDPSAKNWWDTVPYSFVIDWFLPIGSALKTISDFNSSVLTKELLHRIQTLKMMWILPPRERSDYFPGWRFPFGPPVYKCYRREILNYWGDVDLLGIQSGSEFSVSQMIQGTALLTQRLG